MTDSPVGGATREIVLGVVRRDDEVLVVEAEERERERDRAEGAGYRLPGSCVRPDEHGVDALRRAFRERVETELHGVAALGTLVTAGGGGRGEGEFAPRLGPDSGPEDAPVTVSIYQASFVDRWPYRLDAFPVRDPATGGNGDADCRWTPLSAFADGTATLSPRGVADALATRTDAGDGADVDDGRLRTHSAQ